MAKVVRLDLFPNGDVRQTLWATPDGRFVSDPREGMEAAGGVPFFVQRKTESRHCSTECPQLQVDRGWGRCRAFNATLGNTSLPFPVCGKCACARDGGSGPFRLFENPLPIVLAAPSPGKGSETEKESNVASIKEEIKDGTPAQDPPVVFHTEDEREAWSRFVAAMQGCSKDWGVNHILARSDLWLREYRKRCPAREVSFYEQCVGRLSREEIPECPGGEASLSPPAAAPLTESPPTWRGRTFEKSGAAWSLLVGDVVFSLSSRQAWIARASVSEGRYGIGLTSDAVSGDPELAVEIAFRGLTEKVSTGCGDKIVMESFLSRMMACWDSVRGTGLAFLARHSVRDPDTLDFPPQWRGKRFSYEARAWSTSEHGVVARVERSAEAWLGCVTVYVDGYRSGCNRICSTRELALESALKGLEAETHKTLEVQFKTNVYTPEVAQAWASLLRFDVVCD
jgi:hypothetical protein